MSSPTSGTLQSALHEEHSLRNLQDADTTVELQLSPLPAEPEQRYQVLLLLSKFLITLHVIGINSLFGIFQEFYTSLRSSISDAQRRDALVSLVGIIGSG